MSNTVPDRPGSVRASSLDLNGANAENTATVQLATGKKIVDKTDPLGRHLKVKFLGTLDRMRMSRILGGELAKNEVYVGYATLASAVIEIDGDPVPPPVTVRELEFLVDRLGDEGLNAVGEVYQEHFSSMLGGAKVEDAKN